MGRANWVAASREVLPGRQDLHERRIASEESHRGQRNRVQSTEVPEKPRMTED